MSSLNFPNWKPKENKKKDDEHCWQPKLKNLSNSAYGSRLYMQALCSYQPSLTVSTISATKQAQLAQCSAYSFFSIPKSHKDPRKVCKYSLPSACNLVCNKKSIQKSTARGGLPKDSVALDSSARLTPPPYQTNPAAKKTSYYTIPTKKRKRTRRGIKIIDWPVWKHSFQYIFFGHSDMTAVDRS